MLKDLISRVTKSLMPKRQSKSDKSLSRRLHDRVKVTSAVTLEKCTFGLKIMNRETKLIKFNRTLIITSKTTN